MAQVPLALKCDAVQLAPRLARSNVSMITVLVVVEVEVEVVEAVEVDVEWVDVLVDVDVVELVDVVALVVLVVDAPVVEVVIRIVLVVEVDVVGLVDVVALVVLVVLVVGATVVVVSDEPDATNDAASARVTRSNAVPKHPPSLAMTCTVARVVPASLPVIPVGIAVSFLLALFPAFNDKAPCPAGPDTATIVRTPSAEASGSLYR